MGSDNILIGVVATLVAIAALVFAFSLGGIYQRQNLIRDCINYGQFVDEDARYDCKVRNA